MPEIGPDHAEVGDCYSLMARTYLVARNYARARKALQEAYRRIPPDGTKDHLDLLILTGDIEAATNNADDAEQRYTEALKLPQADDVQISEIFARGYYQRAVNRTTLGRRQGALADYRKAEELWRYLEEPEHAARAQWAATKLERADDPSIVAFDGHPSPLVRLEAYRLYQERYPADRNTVANRPAPNAQVTKQLLREAQHEVAIKYQHP
jgi:tetratricopeptide (TPR) repeat protein